MVTWDGEVKVVKFKGWLLGMGQSMYVNSMVMEDVEKPVKMFLEEDTVS